MSRYIDADKYKKDLIQLGFLPALVTRVLDKQPTADVVEVRHGEWIEQYEGSRLLKCSVCGYEYCDLIECGNYCGNCGAKMGREGRERNE